MPSSAALRSWCSALAVALGLGCFGAASARAEGGLYIAGDGFSFKTAAERGLKANRGGQRFFLLTLPAEAAALRRNATPSQTRLRQRVLAANGVLLVCQRDLDNGRIDAAALVPEVVAIRGWPTGGTGTERLFPGEDASQLPASNEALRRLRATCS